MKKLALAMFVTAALTGMMGIGCGGKTKPAEQQQPVMQGDAGGQMYGGQMYGGQTYGGQTYGGAANPCAELPANPCGEGE